ncbi:unnamed protein product, partial [marine sediment metagenome]
IFLMNPFLNFNRFQLLTLILNGNHLHHNNEQMTTNPSILQQGKPSYWLLIITK